MSTKSADEFYSTMEEISHAMLDGQVFTTTDFMEEMHSMGKLDNLTELRERYTYNISPFSSLSSSPSSDDDRSRSVGCLHSMMLHLAMWNRHSLIPPLKLRRSKSQSLPCTSPRSKSLPKQQTQTETIFELRQRYKEAQKCQQHAYIMVQMQTQVGAMVPSANSKSAPTTPVKETADVLKNSNLIGLHLVHPSVIKPLPRHEKQPVGHRTPLRSNLYGRPVTPVCLVPQTVTKGTSSLEIISSPSPTSGPGRACDTKPINHLIDFLPSKRNGEKKSHYQNSGRSSRTPVSPRRAQKPQKPQNEGLTAALLIHDSYRRKTGRQLSPIREKSQFVPSESVSAAQSSSSSMSPNHECAGSVLPQKQKQSRTLTKGISKAVVHEADTQPLSTNNTDNHVLKQNLYRNNCNQATDTINLPCSTNSLSLTEVDRRIDTEETLTVRKENGTVRMEATRQSPQIDLLVTTADEDNAVKQEADIAFFALRPDLLITLAGSDVPVIGKCE
jgi:hypothetical protein